MKRLLCLLLLACAFTATAAFPPFTAFIGTNGLLVISNPVTGKILFDGSGIEVPGRFSTNRNSAISNLMWSTTYFVDTNGNDAIGIFGDAAKPARAPGYAITNTPDGGQVYIRPGRYVLNAYYWQSNAIGAINLFNRSNLTIYGTPGVTILDSPSTVGSLVVLSNCQNITFHGITFKGFVVTNYVTFTGNCAGAMSGVGIVDSSGILFENCQFLDHHNFGLQDLGYNFDRLSSNVTVRACLFQNCGSAITNCAMTIDGGGIAAGYWTVEQCVFQDSVRGIEFFALSGTTPNLTHGYTARNNEFRNNLLSHASADSFLQNGVISGNRFHNVPGYTRRGSNILNSFRAVWCLGSGTVIKDNRITGQGESGIHINSQFGNITGLQIVGNTISGITNPGSAAAGLVLGNTAGGSSAVISPLIAGNTISECSLGAQVVGALNPVFRGNQFINSISAGGGNPVLLFQVFVSAYNSNALIAGNVFWDEGTANMTYALTVQSGNKDIRFFDNDVLNPLTGIINNSAGAELKVWFPPKAVFPAFAAGVYVNAENDTEITLGVGTARTNRLHTPYNGHRVRVRDGTSTITTNIVLMSAAGVINGGLTNMSTNFASATLTGDGTNWNFEAAFP